MILEIAIPDIVPGHILETFTESAIQEIIYDIGEQARNHWIGLANKFLHTSRNDYVEAIQAIQLMPNMAVISLVGQPANIIEHGSGMVDLRDWLLGAGVPVVPRGQKGKHPTADGKGFYRSIPFGHQTPGTSGSAAPPMGDPYRGIMADARKMGREVYKAAKKLEPSKMASDGSRVVEYGGRLPSGMMPKMREHHKTDIYSGMVRVEAAYDKAVQAQYMTFRTISTKVTEGWIRPPTGPRNLAQRTSRWVARMAPKAFEAYARGVSEANR